MPVVLAVSCSCVRLVRVAASAVCVHVEGNCTVVHVPNCYVSNRFVEQVFGAYILANTPATGVVDLTPNPKLTSKPATAFSPIVVHVLEVSLSRPLRACA